MEKENNTMDKFCSLGEATVVKNGSQVLCVRVTDKELVIPMNLISKMSRFRRDGENLTYSASDAEPNMVTDNLEVVEWWTDQNY